jgi:hypothetical protein
LHPYRAPSAAYGILSRMSTSEQKPGLLKRLWLWLKKGWTG